MSTPSPLTAPEGREVAVVTVCEQNASNYCFLLINCFDVKKKFLIKLNLKNKQFSLNCERKGKTNVNIIYWKWSLKVKLKGGDSIVVNSLCINKLSLKQDRLLFLPLFNRKFCSGQPRASAGEFSLPLSFRLILSFHFAIFAT